MLSYVQRLQSQGLTPICSSMSGGALKGMATPELRLTICANDNLALRTNWRSIHAISTDRSMEVGTSPLHTRSQVLSMTWVPPLHKFWEARLWTCVVSWVEQKARPNSP